MQYTISQKDHFEKQLFLSIRKHSLKEYNKDYARSLSNSPTMN